MAGDPKLGPEAAFQAALDRGQFRLQRCGSCAKSVFPPRVVCPHCSGDALEWATASGGGEVYSCTTVRAVAKGERPYNVSLVLLDEGVRLMSTVPDCDVDRVRIGMRVKARIERREGHSARLVFDVADEVA